MFTALCETGFGWRIAIVAPISYILTSVCGKQRSDRTDGFVATVR